MADITLTRAEERGGLPAACLCCGAPATYFVERTLLLRDPHVPGPPVFAEVFLVRFLIAHANTPKLRLRTSFCDQHSHYWLLRTGVLFGGLAALVLTVIVGIASAVLIGINMKQDAPWLSCCAIVPALVVIAAWVAASMLLGKNTVVARLTDDDAVLLKNVDERYAAAVVAAREGEELEPDDAAD